MEKFIKFKSDVNLKDLSANLKDERIIVLRKSQTTDTVQVQVLKKLSTKEIKNAFDPYQVEKIYDEFPYPKKGGKIPFNRLRRLFIF